MDGTPDADDGMVGSLLLVLREYMTDNAKMSDMGRDI